MKSSVLKFFKSFALVLLLLQCGLSLAVTPATISVNHSPGRLIAGQPFSLNWSATNMSTSKGGVYSCSGAYSGAQLFSGTSGSFNIASSASWAGQTTSCAFYAWYSDGSSVAVAYDSFTFEAGTAVLTPPALSFGACSSGTTTAPTAATASCSLSNSGQTAASSISYSGPGGTTVSGPSSCAANSSCGTVTVRTGTSAGSYSGSVSASPNTGSAGSTSVSLTVNAPVVVTPAPTISVWRSMSPLVAGQSYTTSWATTNATSLSFNCTASGSGFAGSFPVTPLSGTAAPYVAPAGWVGYPTTCVWTATGPGGTAQITEGFTTVAGVTPAALSLSNCSNNSGMTSPTPASMSCTLSNTGGTGVGSISYASLADMSVSGPTGSCAASSTCGQVTVTTGGAAKTYSGTLTATANTGTSTSQAINLQVVAPPPPAALSISGCSSVSPTTVPTAASMRCTVSNAGGTAVGSINYAGLTGMNVSGPTGYCAAYATCGDLNISTGTSTKIYSGTLTATPNSGSAAAVAVNLQVLGNTVLQLQDCRTQSPAVSPNAAVMQCMLVNTGYDMVTGIQYSALSGMSVTGPSRYCDGGEECGTVTITTNGDPGSYSGILTVTPTPYTGTKPSISINLRVNQAPAELVLSNCSVNSPAAEPTPATRQCTLTNNGGPAASISYSATGGLIAPTSPSSCAGNGTVCGTVIVQTPTTAGQYDGTLTVTPNNGTGQTMPVSLTVQKSPPTGALSSSEANNAQLKAGHNITFNWTLQNATEATLGCTDGVTSYDRAPINVNSGSRVITVRDEWMGKNIGCSVLANGPGGSFISNMLFFDVPRKPTIVKVFHTPAIPTVGESYTTTWETTDATSVSFSCTASGTGFKGSAPVTPTSGTASSNIAQAAWVGYPSICIWTATGPGGVATYTQTSQVQHAAARLEMSHCEVTTPTTEPTPASRQCKLTNYGGPTSLITYVATGRLIAPTTPSSCAGYGADCGTVIVKTPTDAGEYEGTLTVTPNNGTGQTMPVSLLKVQKNPPTGSLVSSLPQNAKVNVGQTFTLTWTLQNATSATLVCTSDGLFDWDRSPADLTGGSRVVTVKPEWLNKTVGCSLAAENSGGKLNSPMLFIEVVAAQPTITVSQSPTPLIAGQPYTTTWTTTHAKNVSFSCKANGTGFVMDAPVDNVNGTSPENVAQGAWVGNPSTCIWTAIGDGGSATYTQTMETIYPPTTLSLSNCRHNMPVMEPSAATYTCDLKNAGAAISGISHSVTGGMQAEGNPSCAAMSDCGTVVVKTPAVGGSYSGRLSMAYGAGKLVTEDVNLTVSSNRATATLLKLSPTGSTVNSGQTFKLSAALSNASQAFVQCTDGAGTANNVGSIPDAGGELDVAVKPEWVDQVIVCALKARGPVGDIQSEAVTLNVVPPLPTLKVQLISKPDGAPIDGALWVGQSFARTWEVTNAGFVNYYCFAQDTGHNENNAVLHTGVTTSTKGETPTLQAKMEWVGYTSQCVWTAEGKGGTVRWNETIRTEALGMLQLEACELPNPVIYPSKTVLSCQLKNVGKAGVDSIRYETSADLTAEGPTTYCGANSPCGQVKVTMSHFLDNVTGQLSITPNRGAGVSVPLKIHTVFDVALQFGQCTYKNNVMTPGIAEARCPLLNKGFNAAKTIQYQGPSGVEITGPTACANAYTETPTSCGEVLIRTLGPAGNYQGPVTATPDQGYAASFNLDLTVRPLTPEGRVYMTYRAPAIAGEAIPLDWTIYGASTSKNAQLNCSIINDSITVLTQTLTGLSGRAIVPTQAAWANKTVYCEIQAWNLDGASSFVSGQNIKLEPLTQESPMLSLANCETKTLTHSPEPASYTCQVRNHGRTPINHIAYEIGTVSMAVTGPSNCAAATMIEAASCGTMKVVTDTVDNTYFGVLKVTPDVGQGVLERLTLVVDPVAYKAMEASIRLGPNNPVAGKSFTVYWNATNASRTKMPHLYCSKREGDLSNQFISIDLTANSGEVNLATQTDWVGKQGDCGIVFYPENGSDPVMRSAAFTFAQATTHPATITAVADPLPLIVGDKFKIKWATTYASTDPAYPTTYSCSSDNGAYTQGANLSGASGEIGLIVDEKWAGKQSKCNFWVYYEDNSNVAIAYLTLDFKALPLQATIDGNFVPAKPEAGKPYTINWSTTNSSTTTMPNLICTSADGGLAEVIGFTTTQGSMSMVAGKDWGGTHSQCRFTAFTQYERPGTGGFKTLDVEFVGQPHPNLVLRNCQVTTKVKSPAQASIVCDMRNSGAQDATVINYSASNGIQFQNPPTSCAANTECGKVSLIASQVGHYQDIITIIANSNVQGAATIQMDLEVLPADGSGGTTPGTGGGTTTPLVPKLMGEVHGIRSTAEGLLELHGWACLDGSNQALQYSVYSEATSKLGGKLLGTGTANVATENNNTSIANTCHTPGVGHSFVLGLSNYAQSNEGKPLFVEVKEATGSTVLELQCINNNCTMPGTIRIGLTTPEHNASYKAPGEVFMRALISNTTAPITEVAFNIGGEWVTAQADTQPNTYFASKSGLAGRAEAYPVIARVKQGSTTLTTTERLIYVNAMAPTPPLPVTVAITAPVNSARAFMGVATHLAASATVVSGSTVQVRAMKFYFNDLLVAEGVNTSGDNWVATWTPSVIGTGKITASAFDANGVLLNSASATNVSVNTGTGLTAGTATPMKVNITPPYLDKPDAGSLPGSLGVDKNGSANYSIPIAVPPGTNGMVPSLSLNYSSDNTTGSAGLGWSLGGISNIDRCGKTVAVDGVADTVRFEVIVRVPPYNLQPVDRLCLDGQRLILVNGDSKDNFAYWAEGAEYRTEVESFNRITTLMINGRRTFKVEGKNGQTHYYGDTSDSYIKAVGRDYLPTGASAELAHRWRISHSVDRSGNRIDYSYQNDLTTGESKPTAIRWGGKTPEMHYGAVAFEYETREDKREAYVAGARNDENLRLKVIRTSTRSEVGPDPEGGVKVNNYNLSYEYSPSSNRSLLKSIEICDGNNSSNCLPATTFQWGKPDANASKAFLPLGTSRVGPKLTAFEVVSPKSPLSAIVVSDFNGDGKADLLERYRVAANDYQQILYTSNADGTAWDTSRPFARLQGMFDVMESGDFDGDGKVDLLVGSQSLPTDWRICWGRLTTSEGVDCSSKVELPSDVSRFFGGGSFEPRMVKDFNADGRDDIYFRTGPSDMYQIPRKNAYSCLSNGHGFDCIKVDGVPSYPGEPIYSGAQIDFGDSSVGETSTGNVYSDVDGDGRVDKLSLGKCEWREREHGGQPPMEWYCGSDYIGNIKVTSQTELGANDVFGEWFRFTDRQTMVLAPVSSGTLTGDFNADGYSDIVFGSAKLTASSTVKSFGAHICLSKGNSFANCDIPLASSGSIGSANYDHLVLTVGDFDGDGKQDVLRPANDFWTQDNVNGYQLCRFISSGTVHRCENWSGPTFYSFNAEVSQSHGNLDTIFKIDRSMFLGDFDGDGKQDIVTYFGDKNRVDQTQWQIWSAADQAKPGEALDKLISVTNGLGHQERVVYAKANDIATVLPDAALPNGASAVKGKRSVPHRQVIKTLSKATGNGNWLDTHFTYAGYSVDGQGRGSLGFAKVESTQAQSGIINTTWYWQDFPHTGSVRFSQTRAANNCLIAESSTTPDAVTITHGNGARRVIPYVASSTQSKRDLDCSDMGTTVTTVSPPDDYGNSTTSTSTTQVKGGEQFITEQVMRYTQKTWPLSQLDKVTETKTVGAAKAAPRTMDYTYDANGLVETEIKQKGKPAFETITTYTRNGFGLVEQTSLTWLDPQKGASKTVSVATITYTANGRFPWKIKNALGHEEIKTFDPRNGAPVKHTDINSLSTSWQVDGFGRKLKQTTPDGTDIYTYQKQCSPNCPSGAVSVLVTESKRGVDRVAVPSLVFSDTAGHPVRSITWGFDGEMIGSDMIYDSRGRVFETYQPQFTKELTNGALTANLAVRNHYDDLNRIIQADTVDEAGKQYTTTTYRGLQIDFENPKGRTQTTKGQIKTDIRDVAGRLEQSIDANGGITKYEHDPYNNLTKTTDPKLNVVTILYDELGRRTDLYDPDLGWNHYQLNPLGQVIKQTSPTQRKKDAAQPSIAHSTTMVYDDLGRMTARNEFDLTARWVYDGANCVTNKSCGKLIESYTLMDATNASTKDNQQSHSYDSLGRPSTTRLQRDVLYTQRFDYDTWSRPLKESWQRGSESAKVFERRYNEWGYQYQLLKATGANSYAVLWQANKQDASQRLREATLGNGRLVQRDYYDTSGRMYSSALKIDINSNLFSEAMTYDVLGNIAQRTQVWAAIDTARPMESFIENFTYDKLNRLETASVTGYATQTFAYDAIGNIKSKTGTGTGDYLYPASGAPSFDSDGASNNRPHAVKEIPGIGTFGYDANGNMEVGNGRTITWTSFDMPGKISSSATGQGIASSFTYGADHQRTKQIKTDPTVNSTVYYAGAMEVEIKGGTTTIKTYWPGGLGVEIDRPNEAAEWNWTHADRLGSVIAVTNAGGDLVERLAYDAWGKRRNLRGNSTDNNIDGQVDNKGFTGHEMLDKLDLVHMNGRIYDPLVARFMSADPLIQDPEHSQSYNRYTYVWNNPTNLTDPTGFASVIPCDQDSSCVQGSDGNSYGCRDGGGKITNCFEGGDANNEQPSGEQSTNNSPDHTGTPEKKASVTDDLAKGFQDSKTDYGVMEPLVKRTVSEKIGRVVGKVTDFGVDLAKAATGVADADIARAEWNEKKYVRSTIHWMAAVGNAGLTVLTFGEWAAIRAAMFEVVPSGVNVVRSGEFSIVNWNGYPSGVPKPAGPFRLLEGAEYANARDAANSANKTLRKDMELIGKKVDIHEVQPVKFNGNPTDRANKVILDRDLHRKEVTPWWNALQRALEATKP